MFPYRLFLVLLIALLGMSACTERRPLAPGGGDEGPMRHGPLPDEEAENLAWLISGKTWAPLDLYERIRTDLATIRAEWTDSVYVQYPSGNRVYVVDACRHRAYPGPGVMYIHAESETSARIHAGEYSEWDSLNAFYMADVTFPYGLIYVRSTDRVNPYRMMAAYERLPGIRNVNPGGGFLGDPPNLYAYAFDWGIGYLLSFGWGDCPAGCFGYYFFYFRSTKDGIEYVGTAEGNWRRPPQVDWWSEAAACLELYTYGDSLYRNRDVIPPSRITDLTLNTQQLTTHATVSFTSPGDDRLTGQALQYEIRWSPEPITEANWYVNPYQPQSGGLKTIPARPSGSKITVHLDRLLGDTINYIAVRTRDGRDNLARVSNQVASRNILLEGWTRFTSENSALPPGPIGSLFIDTDGRIWAGTPNGAACLSGGVWQCYTEPDLPSPYITAFGEETDGAMWVGTLKGAARFDGDQWTAHIPSGYQGGSREIRAISGTDDGVIWMGVGFDGAAQYDGLSWLWFTQNNSGIGGTLVKSMLRDSRNILWFGTDQGISRYDGAMWALSAPNAGAQSNYIMSIAENRDGSIWCGSLNGYLAIHDGAQWTSRRLASGGAIASIVQTKSGDIWMATPNGIMWAVAGRTDSVILLTPSNSRLPLPAVSALAAGPENTLWIGTPNSGILQWDLSAVQRAPAGRAVPLALEP